MGTSGATAWSKPGPGLAQAWRRASLGTAQGFIRDCCWDSLVSVVEYWESFFSSYTTTSTLDWEEPSIRPLTFSRARAKARRSPRPHAD